MEPEDQNQDERTAEQKLADLETKLAAETAARQTAERIASSRPDPDPVVTTATAQEEPKEFTKAELKAAVAAGQITQDEADDYWEKQVTTRATKAAAKTAQEVIAAEKTNTEVSSELGRYREAFPDIMDPASENRQKVTSEYEKLRRQGQPPGPATELLAAKVALGALRTPNPKDVTRESHQGTREVGGGNRPGSGGERPNTGNKFVDGLTPREKSHYESKIQAGIYKDWKAVEEEMKYSKQHVRDRAARVAG